ncbi:MAG: DUF362 domain-containing protein [Syntrophorhabdales bacterium]|jgi:uncharacterized protein (DUF362 family)
MLEIALRKSRPSSALWSRFRDYYVNIPGVDPSYTDARWQQWKENPDIITYLAGSDGKVVGWIIYNPATSTIEEILVNGEEQQAKILFRMIDELIAVQSLVSAEILASDQQKYRWLVEYGFRPTRSFTANGPSFLKMDLSISVLFERLEGRKPTKAYLKKERVAIEKVPPSQTYEEIKKSLGSLISKLGGLQKFVKPGQTVVIKPNLVADHGMVNGVYRGGVVTDIRIVKALVEFLLPVARKVTIAEGSSINRSATTKMFLLYGYDTLIDLDPRKVSLVDLNADELIEKPVPGAKRMTSRKVPLTLDQADVIINVPVMKLHFAAVASLAVKSLQGAMPPLEKYMSHFFGLWQNLVNIHRLVKPKLHIIDGLIGQEGFGPVAGTPKTMNLLIGGTNPVAVDAVTMRIMGLDPVTSPPVRLAYMQGLGPVEPENISIIGPSIDEVMSPFEQPEIDLTSGRDIIIHGENACAGCAGYLHFAVAKLRRPDPEDPTRLLIDRPLDRKVHIFLGPTIDRDINPDETNIFLGVCQRHHAEKGTHLPGCPPHAEVLLKGMFGLFPDVGRPKYADEAEEIKLERMLNETLTSLY